MVIDSFADRPREYLEGTRERRLNKVEGDPQSEKIIEIQFVPAADRSISVHTLKEFVLDNYILDTGAILN